VYEVLDEKMKTTKKPIFPVLPSILTARKEVEAFVEKGRVFFPDEVTLGKALSKIYFTPEPADTGQELPDIDEKTVRRIIGQVKNGYLSPGDVGRLLDTSGIKRAKEVVVQKENELPEAVGQVNYPLVMKVVGPVHKSDVGGVTLNLNSEEEVKKEFRRMMKIDGAKGVLLQSMMKGTELFAGVKKEDRFGHLVLFGLGGIFIEILKDVRTLLLPVSMTEVLSEMKLLKSYKMLEGVRGIEGVDKGKFAETIVRLGALIKSAPEIAELDLNPLLGSVNEVVAVDARIRIEK